VRRSKTRSCDGRGACESRSFKKKTKKAPQNLGSSSKTNLDYKRVMVSTAVRVVPRPTAVIVAVRVWFVVAVVTVNVADVDPAGIVTDA